MEPRLLRLGESCALLSAAKFFFISETPCAMVTLRKSFLAFLAVISMGGGGAAAARLQVPAACCDGAPPYPPVGPKVANRSRSATCT